MNWYEIATIWRRELKKFWADPGLIVTCIIVPLMGILILGFGLNRFIKIPGLDINYLDYFGPGAIAVISIGAAMFVGFSIIRDKQGYIKELLVVPISRYSILIGKILSEITTQIITLIASVIIIVFFIIKTDRGIEGIILTVLFMFLIVFGFSGLGIVISSIFKNSKGYNQIMVIIIIPVSFLSGAFFPIDGLPNILRQIAYLNPLTYGVDSIRWALIGVSNLPIGLNILILCCFTAAMIVLGVYLFERSFRK
ncbi:ABC transporter permease [Patescibacteria group bacterium]